MTETDQAADDPLLSFTGDATAAEQLRTNLTAIAQAHPESDLGRLVQEVLDGKRPVRDLEADADFMDLMRSGVRRYREFVAEMSLKERRQLNEQAVRLADGNA